MMNSDSDKKIRLAIFASGAGSNAENCLRYFQNHEDISIPLIVTNRSDAGVLAVAKISWHAEIITNAEWKHPEQGLKLLQQYQIDFILLAGYLALVPQLLINTYRHRIFNIHPALLPDFGGKACMANMCMRQFFNQVSVKRASPCMKLMKFMMRVVSYFR